MKVFSSSSLALRSSASVGGSVRRRRISSSMALVAATVEDALRAEPDCEDAGVIVGRAELAADVVREPELGADVLHDARAEAAGEDLVHHAERVEVRIALLGAEADDVDVGLVDVALVREVDAGLRLGEVDLWSGRTRVPCGMARKGRAKLGFHLRDFEVADDADDQVRADDGAVVPGLQVVERDGGDGGDLGMRAVGVVGP